MLVITVMLENILQSDGSIQGSDEMVHCELYYFITYYTILQNQALALAVAYIIVHF